MKKKKSFLMLAEISLPGMGLLNVVRKYKITSRLNKILFLSFLLFNSNGYCCVTCNKELQLAIQESIYTDIVTMLSAFVALAVVVLLLVYIFIKNYSITSHQIPSAKPLIAAAVVLEIGLGGFVDGIVFHQILQWHGMLSNKFPPNILILKSVNMFWDGIFHLFTLLTTFVGIYLLWKVLKRFHINISGSILIGGMLAGWGIFNLIEGIINHQILELHNVCERSQNPNLCNYGFLIFGVLLIIAGWLMIKKNNALKQIIIIK